jgi:hypothetical protein
LFLFSCAVPGYLPLQGWQWQLSCGFGECILAKATPAHASYNLLSVMTYNVLGMRSAPTD